MEDSIAALGFFLTWIVGLWSFFYYRYRTRQDVQLTIRMALEQGQQLSPALLRSMANTPDPATRDLRRGAVALGIGAALVAVSMAVPDQDASDVFLALSSFPLVLGLVFLALWKLMPRPADDRDEVPGIG